MDGSKVVDLPKLSNEMQLDIMHKVKMGKLSIDDALDLARRDQLQMLQKSFDSEEKQASLYNFSVHKYSSYRWQKCVIQIDINTKMVCIISKGIVKRHFPFMVVKNCHSGSGTRFTVSFKGHHDYELEAMSPQDKQKILELINLIIIKNIHPVDMYEKASMSPVAPVKLHEGQLLLQRGGLATCKWKKYEAHLYTGQLTLRLTGCEPVLVNMDMPTAFSVPIIVHLSDGNASVQTTHACDSFILLTNQDEYHFRVPMNEQKSTENVRNERDNWVKAINKQCVDWKHMSLHENLCEDLKLSKDAFNTKNIQEYHSMRETEPESEKTQNNHVPPFQPVPLPRVLSRLPKSVPVPISVPAQALEPVYKQTKELEQASETSPSMPEKTPITLPELPPSPQPETIQSPVLPAVLKPLPPLPPPLPKKKKTISQEVRTKAFHWDPISQDKIAKSFWKQGSLRDIEIDTSRLYEQFQVKVVGHISNLEPSNHVEIMLNAKIAHNFNIFLKSFPVQPKELKDKLFVVNEGDGGLSDEHITSLRRYLPTADDIEMYKSYKGDVSELHLVDQYMMEMCNIPYLSTQLDLLLTLRELPISMNDLKPLISQKTHMCQQLWGCDAFVYVLEYLLAIGNYLNQNSGKEKAKGFRLSSLTKLSQLRGNERKFTLMHALVEQLMLHKSRLATFFQELAEFETVPGASVKGLTAEVDVLKNELQKVIQYRKTYMGKNLDSQHTKFSKDLQLAIEKYQTDLNQLTKRCKEMRKLYTDILVKFGEPLDQDSQELFGWICQFINEFKRIQSELTH